MDVGLATTMTRLRQAVVISAGFSRGRLSELFVRLMDANIDATKTPALL
jgi:hypothetical protein